MTVILQSINSDRKIYYFDDSDELYQWVNENVEYEDFSNWQMIDEEGDCFYL